MDESLTKLVLTLTATRVTPTMDKDMVAVRTVNGCGESICVLVITVFFFYESGYWCFFKINFSWKMAFGKLGVHKIPFYLREDTRFSNLYWIYR